MSTRSYISYLYADGSVASIYCHFDGYVDGVGKNLLAHFQGAGKVKELIKGGDISSIGDDGSVDSYLNRGENYYSVRPNVSENLQEAHAKAMDVASYHYVFDEVENVWFLLERDYTGEVKKPLSSIVSSS